MRKILFPAGFLTLAIYGNAFAQDLPGTDVWLAALENGLPAAPARISDGDGYNNQPHFSADGRLIYYTREMAGANGTQTDIAAFDTSTASTSMVTNTVESEYSPTKVPGRNALSFIRVEADQRQRLWSVDLDNGDMEVMFPAIEPVGYHAWFDERGVAMFILGDVFTLQIARLGEEAEVVASNIGRSLRKHPESGEVLFVDKNVEPWEIAALDPDSGTIRGVMPLFPNSEDFTIDSAGDYWTGNGSKLYKRSPGADRWSLVANFSAHGINKISRLAVHLEGRKIAVVGEMSAR